MGWFGEGDGVVKVEKKERGGGGKEKEKDFGGL